jgi:histone H2A
VSYRAGIQVAAALEYLVAEVVESAGDVAKEDGFKRIKPRHLTMAIRTDDHMGEMFETKTIAFGGKLPHIEPEIEEKPKKSKKRGKRSGKAKKGKKSTKE